MAPDRSKFMFIAIAGISTGTAVFLASKWWMRRMRFKPPSEWRKVGEISQLLCYPVKSLAAVEMAKVECTLLGPKCGWLRDRTLMVTDLRGVCVTARKYPRMLLLNRTKGLSAKVTRKWVQPILNLTSYKEEITKMQITPRISGSTLTFSTEQSATSVSIDLSKLHDETQVQIFGQTVPACDCGSEAAKWLSTFLLGKDEGLRLVYYPMEESWRKVIGTERVFHLMEDFDMGAYSDATSYSMQNEASIADLNERLDKPVSVYNFRPNFVLKGAKAFQEDTWDWLRIGDVTFRNVRMCTRCILTTIDPETGIRDPKIEPLKTMRQYRKVIDPKLSSATKDSPAMGIHLAIRSDNGVVRVGDSVFVGLPEKRRELISSNVSQ